MVKNQDGRVTLNHPMSREQVLLIPIPKPADTPSLSSQAGIGQTLDEVDVVNWLESSGAS
jgi:hypothetical protein